MSRAMRLVGRRVEAELNGADDLAVELRGTAARYRRARPSVHLPEEDDRLVMPERRHETDAGAAFDAVDQHVGELIERAVRDRRLEDA